MFSVPAGSPAREWGRIEGAALVNFQADVQLRRGVILEIGGEALAYLDGQFRRYVAANLDVEARGTARIRAQIQTPLNLFKESGLAARIEAQAKLAAGATLRLGLSVGDFIELVKKEPWMQGLPYRLFEIFLDEVDLGAGAHAMVAVSAMAYANLALTGSLVGSEQAGPGFRMVVEAGVGLGAGAGYRIHVRAGINDVRRLVGQTTDILVDETFAQIADRLPADSGPTRVLINAARPTAKIALRTAYELGELIAKTKPPEDANGQSIVAHRCVQVILEESQRYLLDRLLAAGLESLRRDLIFVGISERIWEDANEIRKRLGQRLVAMPAEPFELTAEAAAYWQAVVTDAVILIEKVTSGLWKDQTLIGVSILWCAAELMFAAARRMLRASDAAAAVALAPSAIHSAFTGPVDSAPPEAVQALVNLGLGREKTASLSREDLVLAARELSIAPR